MIEFSAIHQGYNITFHGRGAGFKVYDPDNEGEVLVTRDTIDDVVKYIDNRIDRLERGKIKKKVLIPVIASVGYSDCQFVKAMSTGAKTSDSSYADVWVTIKGKRQGACKVYRDNEANQATILAIGIKVKKCNVIKDELEGLKKALILETFPNNND